MVARAQSPLVGNILLVAIAVVLLASLSVGVLSYMSILGADPPSVSFDADVSEHSVELVHDVGDSIPVADTTVVFEFPDAQFRVPFEVLALEAGSDDGRITSGEVYRYPHGVESGDVEVRVVHEPSGAVVERVKTTVTDGRNTVATWDSSSPDFDTFTSNQNTGYGSATVADSGRTVRLEGNRWQYIAYDYDVTEDTRLTFEFKSTAQGDIHGIGLEDDQYQTSDRVVRVYGTQNWGVNVSSVGGTYYRETDGWRRYSVDLGSLYEDRDQLGEVDYLVVVMDCENTPNPCVSQTDDGTPTATAYFRNIEISEDDE